MPFIHVTFNLKRIATYELDDEELTIGRTPNNNIVIDNPGVSSTHARIFKEGDNYIIEDLGSKNGTFLKENRIERHQLDYGDVISVFKHQLQFVPFVGNDAPMADTAAQGGVINQSATLVMDRSQLKSAAAREQTYELIVTGDSGRVRNIALDKHSYCIGKSDDCFIHTSGFLAPAISAKLMRQASGYLLVPEKANEVKVNGQVIADTCKLDDGDNIDIRKIRILYQVKKSGEGSAE